jgi:hypothetical protein
LVKYLYEKVKIVDTGGNSYLGTVTDYVYPEDNEPEIESIIVDTLEGSVVEFFEDNISSIDVFE